LKDTSLLSNSDYEKDLYSKTLNFIGYDKVNRDAMTSVREYLYSEDFDKVKFIAAIKEESDPLELKVKLELLKFYVKVDRWDMEKSDSERICTQADIDECVEVALSLSEEIIATIATKVTKKDKDLSRVSELLLSLWEITPSKKGYVFRFNEVFKECFAQMPLQRAHRQILDHFNEKFGGYCNTGHVLKDRVISRTAIRQFMLCYGE